MDLTNRQWKQGVGVLCNYEISDFGEVRNALTKRIMSLSECKQGYPVLRRKISGVTKAFKVHRLVAFLFIENPNGHSIVNHKDGNKKNCHVSNLEWCDSVRNNVHAIQIGIAKRARGADVAKAKLTEDMVRDIILSNESQRVLGKKYGVSSMQISYIRNGVTWNHVTGLPKTNPRLKVINKTNFHEERYGLNK